MRKHVVKHFGKIWSMPLRNIWSSLKAHWNWNVPKLNVIWSGLLVKLWAACWFQHSWLFQFHLNSFAINGVSQLIQRRNPSWVFSSSVFKFNFVWKMSLEEFVLQKYTTYICSAKAYPIFRWHFAEWSCCPLSHATHIWELQRLKNWHQRSNALKVKSKSPRAEVKF